jgi:hypothetical protein
MTANGSPRDLHYHVRFGTVGCLPDDDDIYGTRKDADRAAVKSANQLRDDGRIVKGTVAAGYAVDRINYLMVEPCTEATCLQPPD